MSCGLHNLDGWMRAHVFRDGRAPPRIVKKKQAANFRFVCMAVLISLSHAHTQIPAYCTVFTILLQEEDVWSLKRGKVRREGWVRHCGQSHTVRRELKVNHRKEYSSHRTNKNKNNGASILMTGSWWPPAQVRVVQEPTGSSTVS